MPLRLTRRTCVRTPADTPRAAAGRGSGHGRTRRGLQCQPDRPTASPVHHAGDAASAYGNDHTNPGRDTQFAVAEAQAAGPRQSEGKRAGDATGADVPPADEQAWGVRHDPGGVPGASPTVAALRLPPDRRA